MRIKSILKEQQAQNEHYDIVINGVTSKFWESLVEMNGKPLSEAAVQTNNKVLETMLYQTAMFLPDSQRERFFESLLNPKDNQLDEGVKDKLMNFGKNVVDTAVNIQNKVDDIRKSVASTIVNSVSYIYDKFVPESVKALGAAIIKKVKETVGKMVEKAGEFLKKIAEKLKSLGKQDPCFSGGKNESFDFVQLGSKLYEAIDGIDQNLPNKNKMGVSDNLDYVIGGKAVSAADGTSNKVAWAIAVLKNKGIDVYGSDFRNILKAVTTKYTDKQNLEVAMDETGSMSKWFTDNKMQERISKASSALNFGGQGVATWCSTEPSFVDTHFGADSQFGQAYAKLGLEKETALGGIIKELKNNKGSLFITLASLIFSFASGVGALRIVGLVFASVIPLIITARITDLENKGAPQEQIEFWKKARSISRFINTVIQIFNIGSLIAKGWEATTDVDTTKLDSADANVIAEQPMLPPISELDVTAHTRLTSLYDTSGLAKFDGTLTDAQFTKLQTILNNTVTDDTVMSPVAQRAFIEEIVLSGKHPNITPDQLESVMKTIQSGELTLDKFNGLTTESKDLLLRSNGAIPQSIQNELNSLETPKTSGTSVSDTTADAQDAVVKDAVKNAHNKDISLAKSGMTVDGETIAGIDGITMSTEARGVFNKLLSEQPGFAAKLTDPDQLKALATMGPGRLEEYATTLQGGYTKVLTPKQIVDLGIISPKKVTETLGQITSSEFGSNIKTGTILKVLKDNDIDINNAQFDPKSGMIGHGGNSISLKALQKNQLFSISSASDLPKINTAADTTILNTPLVVKPEDLTATEQALTIKQTQLETLAAELETEKAIIPSVRASLETHNPELLKRIDTDKSYLRTLINNPDEMSRVSGNNVDLKQKLLALKAYYDKNILFNAAKNDVMRATNKIFDIKEIKDVAGVKTISV